jgi:amino acid transporter
MRRSKRSDDSLAVTADALGHAVRIVVRSTAPAEKVNDGSRRGESVVAQPAVFLVGGVRGISPWRASRRCPNVDILQMLSKLTTSPYLRRAVTRWQIVGMSLNGVIGSGVYLLPAAAAALLGPASLWAVPLAGVAVLLLALCFAEAGSHFDEPGGAYIYTREAFGEFAGFQVGWMTWLARLASAAALWNGFVQALAFVVPGAAEGGTRVALIMLPLTFFCAVNLIGVQYAARLELGLAIAKTLPLVLLIAFGLTAIDGSLLVATTLADPASLGTAALLLLYAYAGFENTAAAAGEFKNPQRDVPFALLTVIGAATLLYTLIQLVALGTLPDLATRTEGAPLADAALVVIGAWGGLLMTIGAALSIGGNVGNTMFVGSRYLHALASGGFGPPILARVHPRFQTPAWAIVTQTVLTAVLALSGSFVQLALLSVVARSATYIGTAAAVPVLRRKLPARDQTIVLPGGATIPALALLVCAAFLASSTATHLIAALIALVLGAALYGLRRGSTARRP